MNVPTTISVLVWASAVIGHGRSIGAHGIVAEKGRNHPSQALQDRRLMDSIFQDYGNQVAAIRPVKKKQRPVAEEVRNRSTNNRNTDLPRGTKLKAPLMKIPKSEHRTDHDGCSRTKRTTNIRIRGSKNSKDEEGPERIECLDADSKKSGKGKGKHTSASKTNHAVSNPTKHHHETKHSKQGKGKHKSKSRDHYEGKGKHKHAGKGKGKSQGCHHNTKGKGKGKGHKRDDGHGCETIPSRTSEPTSSLSTRTPTVGASRRMPSASPSTRLVQAPVSEQPFTSPTELSRAPSVNPIPVPTHLPTRSPLAAPIKVPTVPTSAPTGLPVASPQPETISPTLSPLPISPNLDCSFQGAFGAQIQGGAEVQLQQVINQVEETVTVRLVYEDLGWLGFAFSKEVTMVPNIAVIGLPDANTVLKYTLGGRSENLVLPLEDGLQTLTDTSIFQNDTHTVLTFTKPLIEDSEQAVTVGDNTFIWAVGSGNTLAYHGDRGGATTSFNQCLDLDVDKTDAPLEAPTSGPTTDSILETIPPTTALASGIVVSATKFNVDYVVSDSRDPTDQEFKEAQDVTLQYLEAYFVEQFAYNVATNLDKFVGATIGWVNSITQASYDVRLVFAASSAVVPSEQDIDTFLLAAFEQPFVSILISKLGDLAGNPFLATTDVNYDPINRRILW